jgi:ABC-2 type transport system permease protein
MLADLESGVRGDFALRLSASILVTFAAMLPYLSLSFMTAVLARSTAAGIGVGLAVFFLEGQAVMLLSAVGGIIKTATEALLAPNVAALLALPAAGDVDTAAALKGGAIVAAYCAAFLAVAFWRFARRDVTLA